MPSLNSIREHLRITREKLLRAADAVSGEQWKASPAPGSWSAAEVFAHLTMVERVILGGADRIIQEPPQAVSLLARLHRPLWLVTMRVRRVESPIPLDPAQVSEKEAALTQLQAIRERTLVFLEETSGRDYSGYRWKHPFLGSLNFYEWFRLVGNHEVRHAKQIQETVEKFQKLKHFA
ncbi:MAG: DinB family protein [Acidobacteriia bacterium]|nr:DinB family protein [Terriglobia bacterium]